MRNRLALYFAIGTFALVFLGLCSAGSGSDALGLAIAYAAISACVGALSFSDSGLGSTLLRLIGCGPLVFAIACVLADLTMGRGDNLLGAAAMGVFASFFLLPLYVPITLFTLTRNPPLRRGGEPFAPHPYR